MHPDVTRDQDISVAKTKKAISHYKKAIGLPQGVAELSTFYCEETIRLLSYCGMDDGDYFAALVRMFGQALTVTVSLPLPERASLLKRLNAVRSALRGIGFWGVEDDCDMLWQELVPEVEA